MAVDLSKSPALSRCASPYSSRHLMVNGRSPAVHRAAASQSRTTILEIHRLESIARRDRHGQRRSADAEASVQGADLRDGRRDPTGQEEGAVYPQRAGVGSPRPRVRPGRSGVEQHEARSHVHPHDQGVVPVGSATTGAHLRRRSPRAETPGGPRRPVATWQGPARTTPWSTGVSLQRLCRLLRSAMIGVLHIQSVGTADSDLAKSPDREQGGGMRTSCAVVGAGPAGIAISRELVRRGVDHVVLERDEVASHVAQPALGQLPAEHVGLDERHARTDAARCVSRP